MALPSSGSLSMSQIRSELVNGGIGENIPSTGYGLRALSSAAGKSTPDGMDEFYGYSAGGGGTCTSSYQTLGSTDTEACCNPYIGTLYYISGSQPGTSSNRFKTNNCSVMTSITYTGYIACGTNQFYSGQQAGVYYVNDGLMGSSPITCPACGGGGAGCTTYLVGGSILDLYSFEYTDCCGSLVNVELSGQSTFCAQVGSVFSKGGSYTDTGTSCTGKC